jgi:hypothetical protein
MSFGSVKQALTRRHFLAATRRPAEGLSHGSGNRNGWTKPQHDCALDEATGRATFDYGAPKTRRGAWHGVGNGARC